MSLLNKDPEDYSGYDQRWHDVQSSNRRLAKVNTELYNITSLSQAWNAYCGTSHNDDKNLRDVFWNVYVYIRDSRSSNRMLNKKFMEDQDVKKTH